jgi:predicted DNA-binding protein (UPF0251 family)
MAPLPNVPEWERTAFMVGAKVVAEADPVMVCEARTTVKVTVDEVEAYRLVATEVAVT